MVKTALRWLMAAFYVVAGALHFAKPQVYYEIMPPYLPWRLALIYVSGVAEIAGGVGVLFAATRRAAGWGLIALLISVLPANLEMALTGYHDWPQWLLWTRLPFQLVFVAWAFWVCDLRRGASRPTP